MKIIFTLICTCFILGATAQKHCAIVEYSNASLLAGNSANADTTHLSSIIDTLPNAVITVPIVVHILYNNSTENISDQQVLSQLVVLNQDYRRLNADTVNTPDPFKSVAADAKIVFCLAHVDTNGRYTTGIIRKHTNQSYFLADDGMKFASSGGDDGWNSTKYLNVWVCCLFDRTLGYGVMPGSPANRDGVVIDYNCFGTIGTAAAPYNLGRTATHEIGHWLGLRHLWGDAACGSDDIADTPPQETANYYCQTFPHTSACSINSYGDMFMDYMDFSNDACMNMFTHDQAIEMRSQFAKGGFRNSFLNPSVCDSSNAVGGPLPADSVVTNNTTSPSVTTYPNPFSNQVTIFAQNADDVVGKVLKLYSTTGKLITTQVIESQKTVLYLNNLASGIYFLKIEGGNNSMVYKLVRQPSGGQQ